MEDFLGRVIYGVKFNPIFAREKDGITRLELDRLNETVPASLS